MINCHSVLDTESRGSWVMGWQERGSGIHPHLASPVKGEEDTQERVVKSDKTRL
jgi:hypothetical protein